MEQGTPPVVPDHIEHRITAPDGRTLAVAEWGDPDGLPVLAIHGTPGGRISWYGPDPDIDARYRLRRLTVDRPGYGHSTPRPGRRVVDFVDDLVTVAEALRVEEFVVTGGSGGGPHALACAATLPQRVLRCLVQVSLAPLGAPGLDEQAWLAGMAPDNVTEFRAALAGESALRAFCEPDRQMMLERLAAGRSDFLGDGMELSEEDVAQLIKHAAVVSAHVADALAPGIEGWVDDDLAFVAPWGFDVGAIQVPVLVSYGRADTLVPPAHGDWLAAHIPSAQVEVTEAGHLGDDENVERHNAWIAGRPA